MLCLVEVEALYTAVTRRSGREPELTRRTTPQFALPLATAMAAATYGAAHSCKAESWSGTLEKGKSADFVVLDTDLFKEHGNGDKEQTILKTNILQTWLQGEKVFDSSSKDEISEGKSKSGCTVLQVQRRSLPQ